MSLHSRVEKMSADELASGLLGSIGTSYWLQDRVREVRQHDCLDFVADCELLFELAKKAYEETTGREYN